MAPIAPATISRLNHVCAFGVSGSASESGKRPGQHAIARHRVEHYRLRQGLWSRARVAVPRRLVAIVVASLAGFLPRDLTMPEPENVIMAIPTIYLAAGWLAGRVWGATRPGQIATSDVRDGG